MATDKEILIDIDGSPEDDSFKFQEFSPSESKLPYSEAKGPTIKDETTDRKLSLWSLEYFQQFFDVDTDTVVERIIASMRPKPGINYLQHHIKSKPDLYGPFWVCVTLVFTIAISGNMANYLQAASQQSEYRWKYDFHAVSSSAMTIFLYAWFVPIILWAVLKYQGNEHFQLSLLELMCVYGYSLSVYIPISILWVIQVSWIQWILVFVGAALSGYVLIQSIGPAFGDKNFVLLLVFLALHVFLAVGFMLYFFHVPPMVRIDVHPAPTRVEIHSNKTI